MKLVYNLTFGGNTMTTSNNDFVHIELKSPDFTKYYQRYAFQLNSIQIYLSTTKNLTTATANTYLQTLTQLIINYEHIYHLKFPSLYTIAAANALEKLLNHPDFHKYNNFENHLPQITITLTLTFIHHQINQTHLENFVDDSLNVILNQTTFADNFIPLLKSQVRKPVEQNINGIVFPRNQAESFYALKQAHWQCELDPCHATFTNALTDHNYLEIHHLIPMAFQNYYTNDLDIVANIVCLCPNCHRKLTFATNKLRTAMLQTLFDKHQAALTLCGISVPFDDLLLMYDIIPISNN